VWSSERGRRFPTKAWDEEYFQMLADSEHVLCPSGDYQWSYRFFEACLCGAVPIVEAGSPLYDGFRYRLMTDRRDAAPWSAADAEHNYRPCAAGSWCRSTSSMRAAPPGGAAAAGGQRGSSTQRTAAVVNSRVRRFAISRSGRIGSSSKLANGAGWPRPADEAADGHLVQAALRDGGGAVGLVQRPPPHQRPLREEQVREREHRVDVAAERVVTRSAERRQHLAARPQQAAHVRQDAAGSAKCSNESSETISRRIAPLARERAAIGDADAAACSSRARASAAQIEPDDMPGAVLGDLDGSRAGPQPKSSTSLSAY
jgi:hypothetical protein